MHNQRLEQQQKEGVMKPLILILATLLSAPAMAQSSNCAPRDAVVQKLASLTEIQSGIGLASKQSLIEIWTSGSTGTWTVVMTFTSGVSCIMAYGSGWVDADKPVVTTGTPT